MECLKSLLPCLLMTLVVACGGGSGSGGGAGAVAQTGTVSLTLTDGPTDDYSAVIMVIREVRLLSDGGQDILVLDEPKEVDFLKLSNFSEVLLKREVIAGTYSKIRLILDSLTVVLKAADGTETPTSVDLHGLRKVDINPQGTFQVRGGQQVIVHLDLDLARSIHVVTAGNSNRVNFRPVIFANVSTLDAFDKLFRVEGTIDSIDEAAGTLNVCDIRRLSGDGAKSPDPKDICVFTDPNDATSYFDSESAPLAARFGGLMPNDPVVMYGTFDAAPTDRFIPGVIAMGSSETFQRERGISSEFVPDLAAAGDPGTMNLDQVNDTCLLTPAERVVSVAEPAALYQEDSQGDATRLTDRSQIEACRATEVEGSVVATPDPFLRAFVVIQGDPLTTEEEFSGSLGAVSDGHPGEYALIPNPSGPVQCVVVSDVARVVQITMMGDTWEITELQSVPVGVDVKVTGTRAVDDPCLIASDVLLEISA